MEKLFERLKEYLGMDTEIPFAEFSTYYQSLIGELNQNYQDLDRDGCLKARYICSIVQANAEARAKTSKTNAKAFKKMSAKTNFWADAINFRLLKEGMSQGEIDQAMEDFNSAM